MSAFMGLDLSDSVWRISLADVESAGMEFSPLQFVAEALPEFNVAMDQHLRIDQHPEKAKFVPDEERAWLDDPLRKYCQQLAADQGGAITGARVCLALPYASPPLVRAGVPRCLLAHHTSVNAVEAPFAFCIDIVARKAIQLPACVLVVNRNGEAAEATVVQITARDEHLTLEAIGHIHFASLDEAISEHAHRVVAACHPAPTSVHAVGEDVCALASKLAGSLNRGLAVQGHEETTLANGAARMAAFLQSEVLHRTRYSELTIRRICPWNVGILTKTTNGTFWRRLFAAGSSFGVPVHVRLTGQQRNLSIALAHCGPRLPEAPLWISRKDFPKYEMRLFALRYLHQRETPSADQFQRLRVELHPVRIGHLWGDRTIDLSVELEKK